MFKNSFLFLCIICGGSEAWSNAQVLVIAAKLKTRVVHNGALLCKEDILFLSGSGGSNPLPRIFYLCLCSIVVIAFG